MLAAFGRRVLTNFSVTGKTSNAFRKKEAKPQLDQDKLYEIIGETKFTEKVLRFTYSWVTHLYIESLSCFYHSACSY